MSTENSNSLGEDVFNWLQSFGLAPRWVFEQFPTWCASSGAEKLLFFVEKFFSKGKYSIQ